MTVPIALSVKGTVVSAGSMYLRLITGLGHIVGGVVVVESAAVEKYSVELSGRFGCVDSVVGSVVLAMLGAVVIGIVGAAVVGTGKHPCIHTVLKQSRQKEGRCSTIKMKMLSVA